jgi:hypothetical protein
MATGAALGAVDPERAAALRPEDPSDAGAGAGGGEGGAAGGGAGGSAGGGAGGGGAAGGGEAEGVTPAQRAEQAELAWLDGVVAFARRDAAGVEAARGRVTATGARYGHVLDASLGALRLHLDGRTDDAIRTLMAAQDSAADRFEPHGFRFVHPHVSTVDRVLLGRWLLDADRPADALRMLTWHEAIFPAAPPMEVVSRTVGLLGVYERARAEDAMGRFDDARAHYLRFVEAMDQPVPALRPLVEDALRRVNDLAPRLPG